MDKRKETEKKDITKTKQIKTKQTQIQTYTCTFFNRYIFFTSTRLYQQFLKDLPNITFYSTKQNLRVTYKNFWKKKKKKKKLITKVYLPQENMDKGVYNWGKSYRQT